MSVALFELDAVFRGSLSPENYAGPAYFEDLGSLDLHSSSALESVAKMGSDGEAETTIQECSESDVLDEMSRLRAGCGDFGCVHYRRRCRIRSPCCGKVFDCRHCHNDAMNHNEKNPSQRHDLPRHGVQSVLCTLCGTEQGVSQICKKCGVCMGEYFCEKCKFFDDDTSKNQFHCDSCGICRVGGKDKFFHCEKCGCCYSLELQKSHFCVENAMHHNCPVCFDYLFDSVQQITVMRCGHTIHAECLKDMYRHSKFSCPMCSKSVFNMSPVWERLDQEVAATPMPDIYQDKMVWILCNDCGASSEVSFHIVAQKCLYCRSYNTRQISAGASTS